MKIWAGIMDLPTITHQAWLALEESNQPPRLYLRGGVPARLEFDEDGRPILKELTVDRIRHELARSARWYEIDTKGQEQDAKPPMDVMRDVLATPNPPLPVLNRIVEVPTFAPDGTLQTDPGYHLASRCYHAPAKDFVLPSVPANVTWDDLVKARNLILDELLGDFPLVSDADRAHAVELLLLPFARDLIDGPTPNHLIESPEPGTGKGLLADVTLQPSLGKHVAVMAQARDGDEWRKRLIAVFRQACSAVIIDNVTQPLYSGELASALTAVTWQDRILGKSDTIQIPVRCVWVTTANNPVMSTEIARRSIRIRLDACVERPWQRSGFKHRDLRTWVHEHRGELVWSALVLIQNWISAGRPKLVEKPLGSYECWSEVMGSILVLAGIPGFLSNLDEFYEIVDTEISTLREFVALWYRCYRDMTVGVDTLFPLTEQVDFGFNGSTDRAKRIEFGKLLSRNRDRVIDGYQIVAAGKEHHAALWRLIPTRQE